MNKRGSSGSFLAAGRVVSVVVYACGDSPQARMNAETALSRAETIRLSRHVESAQPCVLLAS
jgi:hypothetical protein